MEEVYRHIIALNDETIRRGTELRQCLMDERRYLIEFKIQELPQTSLRKESLISTIVKKRKELQSFIRFHFGIENPSDLESKLDESYRAEWRECNRQWLEVWETMRDVCASNQNFLKQSLKNLGLLVENLKKLLGDHSVYTPQGRRIDLQKEGKVIRAAY